MEDARYVLGLDLAMGTTGYAIYDLKFNRFVEIGSINTDHIKKKKGIYQNAVKLKHIYDELNEITKDYPLHGIGIERGFSRFNNATQVIFRVHGVANLLFNETNQEYYPPKKVKETIMHGNATKIQLAEMIKSKFNSLDFKNDDESDATAVALTYMILNNLIDWVKP